MCVLSIKVPIRKKSLETYLMILVFSKTNIHRKTHVGNTPSLAGNVQAEKEKKPPSTCWFCGDSFEKILAISCKHQQV